MSSNTNEIVEESVAEIRKTREETLSNILGGKTNFHIVVCSLVNLILQKLVTGSTKDL